LVRTYTLLVECLRGRTRVGLQPTFLILVLILSAKANSVVFNLGIKDIKIVDLPTNSDSVEAIKNTAKGKYFKYKN
jgi:hypothetical protein